jgi:hypothetical protein
LGNEIVYNCVVRREGRSPPGKGRLSPELLRFTQRTQLE